MKKFAALILALILSLTAFSALADTLIIGIPDDKDYAGVIREMNPAAERIILTKSQNPHYIFTDAQCKKMLEYGIATVFTDSVSEAIGQAKHSDYWRKIS